jgi:O-acetylhomoserine/O-acetylserine sulfhydrylase-like pyridoxal-dependent enzyme
MNKPTKKFNTNAIREGIHMTEEGEHSEAMFLTSSFVFKTAKQAADRFILDLRILPLGRLRSD